MGVDVTRSFIHNQNTYEPKRKIERSRNIWFSPPDGVRQQPPVPAAVYEPAQSKFFLLLAETPTPQASSPRIAGERIRYVGGPNKTTIFG